MSDDNFATLVAIAKNEGKYISEWIAHNLAIGFDKIVVFSNDSTDEMCSIVSKISSHDSRVLLVDWPSIEGTSPQVSAYNHALSIIKSEWISFLDVDEFIVPFADGSIREYLNSIPSDISSIHVNWRNFGSSGQQDDNYEFVTRTFTRCAPEDWGNQRHFKSLARVRHATDAHIHDIATKQGRRVLSDMKEFDTESRGLSNRIVHERIQINHYQCKTYAEFRERMLRGDANYASKTAREHTAERFAILDRNEEFDDKILSFKVKFDTEFARIISYST